METYMNEFSIMTDRVGVQLQKKEKKAKISKNFEQNRTVGTV